MTRTLERLLRSYGVCILLGSRAAGLERNAEGRCVGVKLQNGLTLEADAVILATGGLSYPATGSTGDGFRMAAEVGHTVLPGRASLCGLNTVEAWPASLQGLSLRNVTLTLKKGRKVLYTELGEMLFTHFGISGPLAL